MPFKNFEFCDKPDVRLVVMDNTVFKIKLTCQHKSECLQILKECQILNIFEDKKKWETANKLKFEHKGKTLQVNPSIYTFYVDPRKAKKAEAPHKDEINKTGVARKRKINDKYSQSPCFDIANQQICESHITIKKPTVLEYGQKNRHDIESQNLNELLRMQEMAKPTVKEIKGNANKEEEISKPTGFINCIKKLFGR